MRVSRTIIGYIFVVLVGFAVHGGSASAQTISAHGTITITAVVAPNHYVMIDSVGKIIQIDSNTTEDTVPLVYFEKTTKGNERSLTPEISAQYQKLVPPGSSKVGTLYKYQPPQSEQQAEKKTYPLNYSVLGLAMQRLIRHEGL